MSEKKYTLIVRPAPAEFINYDFVGSGSTQITKTENNEIVIYSPPIGGLNIIGSGSTTVTQVGFDVMVSTPIIDTSTFAQKSEFTGHTSNDDIHFTQAEIQIDYSQVDNTPVIPTIPTDISAFNNDAGYITAASLPVNVSELNNDEGYITSASLPTNVSELTNDANYIASGDSISQLVNDSGYITASSLPTSLSELSNDVGFITGLTWTEVQDKPNLVLQSEFTGHTANTNIHYEMSGITITESQISNLGTYTPLNSFTAHTQDNTIHFTQAQINISRSQISDMIDLVGSGDTVVTLSGNTYTIYSESGDEAVWGNITGSLSNQTDLQTALDEKTNQVDFTGHTSNTDIHFPMSGISITESQISDLGTYTPLNSFTAHTQDNTIHFTQAQISITESQISDLGVYATQTDFTGHTQDSSIHFTEASISLDYDTQLTGKPSLGSIAGFDLWQGTQGQYDALGTYDNMTIYLIEE